MIQIQGVSKNYAEKVIYSDASLSIYPKEKIGLIGRNGVGKSTLFDMLMDLISFDGNITINKNLKVGYYTQDLAMDETLTVNDTLYKEFEHLFEMEKELLELSYDFENNAEVYDKLFQKFESSGGYFITSNINAMIKIFKLEPVLSQEISTLSGGQKGRVALAKLLLSKPDILLLDEPLNHLDLEAIEWLEGFINNYVDTCIVISHDRFFLDNVCNYIVEVKNHSLYKYKGNYTDYLKQCEHNSLTTHNIYDKQQIEIKKMKEQIKQYRIWGNARDSEKMFRKAKEVEKRLARIDEIEAPVIEKDMRLTFNYSHCSATNIFWANNLAIGYDEVLLDGLNFDIYNGEKIAFVGANGCGKSTLLKVLANKLPAISGEIDHYSKIKVAYFDQIFENLDNNNTIYEEVHKDNILLNNFELRSHLAKFLFRENDLNKKISDLSGGECVRVSMAKLSLQESNVLILDEPTNHLDLESKQIVEMTLSDYEGTILFASHDRYLINRLATKIFEFSKDSLKIIDKDYNEYIIERDLKFEVLGEKKENTDYNLQKQVKSTRKKLSNIEDMISNKEQEIRELEPLKFDEEIYTNSKKYNELLKQIENLHQEIENLIEESIELEQLLA